MITKTYAEISAMLEDFIENSVLCESSLKKMKPVMDSLLIPQQASALTAKYEVETDLLITKVAELSSHPYHKIQTSFRFAPDYLQTCFFIRYNTILIRLKEIGLETTRYVPENFGDFFKDIMIALWNSDEFVND